MTLGLTYNDLKPVANNVRAALVRFNPSNELHEPTLRKVIPPFLGGLAAVHGTEFDSRFLDAAVDCINAKEVELDFLVVATDLCSPVLLAGLATSVRTFGAQCDENNNLKLYPYHHGEDLFIDDLIAKQFKVQTQSLLYPKGIGAGTWLMREQIIRSISKPHWVYAGRDNEHFADNLPIIGVMNKFGAVHGTDEDSSILELLKLTDNFTRRWGVNNIESEELPADALGLRPCPNNFLSRWASKDGKQQIAVIFTKLPSALDGGEPVVWTKIKSNGDLPEPEMLKEVLATLLVTGCNEISKRQWGCPRISPVNDLSNIFGGPVPPLHIHAHQELEIQKALRQMGLGKRVYGKYKMRSGEMRYHEIAEPEKTVGLVLPNPTEVNAIHTTKAYDGPFFAVVEPTKKSSLLMPNL
ncbi:MAG: hypothetical protein AB7H77_03640 [Bdellovibrionales bacterium]